MAVVQQSDMTHEGGTGGTQGSDARKEDDAGGEGGGGGGGGGQASSSPRGVLEIPIAGSESDHSGSSTCSWSPRESRNRGSSSSLSSSSNWKKVMDALRKMKSTRSSSPPPLAGGRGGGGGVSKREAKRLARIRSADDEGGAGADGGGGVIGVPRTRKPSWRNFDYSELAAATDDFSPENLIGKGGHAEVYRGRLSDGQTVAVKRLGKKEKEEVDRIGDFLSELGIVAHVDHPNAARLLGFGIEGGLYFVLRFSPNGSLASLLHGSTGIVDWTTRFKVAVGVAEGLQYLHHHCPRRIIHRDIKASNILLNEDYEPQISDFGLAKWLPEKWVHHVIFPIEGTIGYLAPEYFMHGIVDEKTDVFAFGVLLLELMTGRRAVDSCRRSLVMWAKPLLDANNVKDLVDPQLGEAYDEVEMKRASLTASMCIHHLSTMRPNMKQVVKILRGEDGTVEWKQKSVSSRTLLLNACDAEDYSCSTYLDDLNRHMQLVLE
ncbi:receptor-like cytosolic serine/threonine-protein kinase RBK1 isoform X1 [Syzygium oleosum]|uniref:receptor-like cytosolic serine/threonine-protein kinase RBK1 isoform X1 n=1 Tax=Syzygium oleosum TaxID=219896 RepID=UPI0024BA2BB9|nr:receptor-like cytosolic serine/threonine-protein kinase RBK1 isoform X1 [Syzygium oleosum]